ncbi:MAG: SDR family oxidoreductase [Clostridiales Family XIII bacterium]|jgi:gluconate 5-dehydrogenase|nr:SDR family oxidoreductase [Clostridiales Family XIII bacterium]
MKILDYTNDTIKGLFDLSGKTAIITGGGGGLGLSMARGLADFGANLVLTGRTQETLDKAVASLSDTGAQVLTIAADTLNPDDCQRIVDETVAKFGAIDILIPAAGVARRFPAEDFPKDAFELVVDTNVKGTWYIDQAVAKQMIKQFEAGKSPAGKIINITSVRANNGLDLGYGAYATSKGAVVAMTRQQAVEWAKFDINVNALGPTIVMSELTKPIFSDPVKAKVFTDRIQFHRAMEPGELIGSALYLASAASDFVTGQILYVDGGCVAG